MKEQALKASVTPPSLPALFISRKKLVNLIRENSSKRVILIYSPAGYGKSTLAQDYLESTGAHYAWLSVTPLLNNVYTFFEYAVYSIREVNPSFGRNTLKIIESDRQRYFTPGNMKYAVRDIVSTFSQDVEEGLENDFSVVLDDFHYLGDSDWSINAFDLLFENFPEKLRFIITTRHIPDLNFIPLVVKDNLLKVGMDELFFSSSEIKNLLNSYYSRELQDEDFIDIEKKLGGWITGIHLLLQGFGNDFKRALLPGRDIPENYFNYLAEEAFNKLDKESQEFLLRTCMLDNFDHGVCMEICKPLDVREIRERLLNNHTFLQKYCLKNENGPVNETFNYLMLFKNFLSSKLYRTKSEEQIAQLLKKAAAYYLKLGDIIHAVNYFLASKDYRGAVPIIKENFDSLFNKARFEILWNWINQINGGVTDEYPALLYFKGLLFKYYEGDLERSLEVLTSAEKVFREKREAEYTVKSLISKCSVLLNLGRTRNVIEEITGALNRGDISESDRASLLYFLGYSYFQLSEYETSEKYTQLCIKICSDPALTELRSDSYNLLGHINLIRGEFTSSINYYGLINDDSNVMDNIETLCNLVLLYSQTGNYGEAETNMLKLKQVTSLFPSPLLKIPRLLAEQALYFEKCMFSEASRLLEEINRFAARIRHHRYIYLSYRLLTDCFYYMHENKTARQYHELARNYLEVKNELKLTEFKVVETLLKKNSGLSYDDESVLTDAYKFYISRSLKYNQAQISLHLSDYYYIMGNEFLAKKYLSEFLDISSQNKYVSFLLREYIRNRTIFIYAMEKNLDKAFIGSVIETARQYGVQLPPGT